MAETNYTDDVQKLKQFYLANNLNYHSDTIIMAERYGWDALLTPWRSQRVREEIEFCRALESGLKEEPLTLRGEPISDLATIVRTVEEIAESDPAKLLRPKMISGRWFGYFPL